MRAFSYNQTLNYMDFITSSSSTGYIYPAHSTTIWPTYDTMTATITLQNNTSLSKEEFNAKVQKLITKLSTKFIVKDYEVTF